MEPMPTGAGRSEEPLKELVALLGRRDAPTDGVEDYCSFLGRALSRRGIKTRSVRVPWSYEGWVRALRSLWRESAAWRNGWVLLQYTTMAWSRRGLPFGALAVLQILRKRGVRCAVVFHEPSRQPGERWVDEVRGACQDWLIQRLYRGSTKAIFADPLERVAWLPKGESKAIFIPIGANIPEPDAETILVPPRNENSRTIVVFCVSDPPDRDREINDIAQAIRYVAQKEPRTRLIFLGRGTHEAKEEIERAFESVQVEVQNLGLQSADEVSRILSRSDAMLCVRGRLYARRGSAIAGIACGLPIVAYAGAAEGTPVAEAGVELVPYGNREALGKAIAHVLENGAGSVLRCKSMDAHRRFFSWDVIAGRVHEALNQTEGSGR